MTLITKDHNQYECSLIDFTPNREYEDPNIVEITLWDGTILIEDANNIAYIN